MSEIVIEEGELTNISQRTAKNGNTFYSITVGNNYIFCWGGFDQLLRFQEGDYVRVEFELKNGQYKTLKKIGKMKKPKVQSNPTDENQEKMILAYVDKHNGAYPEDIISAMQTDLGLDVSETLENMKLNGDLYETKGKLKVL